MSPQKNVIKYTEIFSLSIIILTFIGLVMRLYDLGKQSLWLDEASTHYFSVMSVTDIWRATAGGEFNPPLFYWIEHAMLFLGNNEFILRVFPAIIGAATIPVFYYIGKEIMDERVGFVSALLLTFSPFHLFYSQEARAYTTSLFFISIAILFFAIAMRDNSKRNWCLFGLFSGLAIWSHFYCALLIIFLFGIAIVKEYSRHGGSHLLKYSEPVLTGIYVFVLSILPLLFVLPKLFASRVSTAPAFGFMGPEVFTAVVHQFGSIGEMWSYLMVLLFALGVFTLYYMRNKLWVVLAGSVVWVSVITFFLSYRMPIDPRYMIYMLPVYFTGIAVLVIYKSEKTVLTSMIDNILFIAIFAIIAMSVVSSFMYYGTNSKEDWRGVGVFMEKTAYKGDVIVLVPGYDQIPFNYYYNNSTYGTIQHGVLSAAELDVIKAEHPGRVWYVMTGDIRAADPDGDTLAWMEKNTRSFANYNGVLLLQ